VDGDDLNPDEGPELTPEAKKVMEAFDKLMADISDPVESGYSVIAEMFNGLVTAGLKRLDSALLVASYIALHDYIGPTEEEQS